MHTFSDYARQLQGEDYSRLVVKIGSEVLKTWDDTLSVSKIGDIGEDIAYLKKVLDKDIICVSSAAILAGKGQNKLEVPEWMSENASSEDIELARKQAYSALGQVNLVSEYSHSLSHFSTQYGQLRVAQNLLTYEDFIKESHRTNIMNQLEILLHNNIVPIWNENDATVTQEITVGDNDHLAALGAVYGKADAVIKLSSEEGIKNYAQHPIEQAGRVYEPGTLVDLIDDPDKLERDGAVTSDTSYNGRGGGLSTLGSAKMLHEAGIDMYVINGKGERCMTRLLESDIGGSYFMGSSERSS